MHFTELPFAVFEETQPVFRQLSTHLTWVNQGILALIRIALAATARQPSFTLITQISVWVVLTIIHLILVISIGIIMGRYLLMRLQSFQQSRY